MAGRKVTSDDELPIYRRSGYRLKRPPLLVTGEHIRLRERILNPKSKMDHYTPLYKRVHEQGAPHITFIGSSHVARMRDLPKSKALPNRVKRFLANTKFVGVGGLKYWTAQNELNGVFETEEKLANYGNQWATYKSLDHKAKWAIVILGSNDADDGNGYLSKQCALNTRSEYFKKAPKIVDEWLRELKPHVKDLFETVQKYCPEAALGYIPILPRVWWSSRAKELARRLDHMVTSQLLSEYNIRVKKFTTRSLFVEPDTRAVKDKTQDMINPAFLLSDNTHLNVSGYKCLLNNVLCKLMDLVGAATRQSTDNATCTPNQSLSGDHSEMPLLTSKLSALSKPFIPSSVSYDQYNVNGVETNTYPNYYVTLDSNNNNPNSHYSEPIANATDADITNPDIVYYQETYPAILSTNCTNHDNADSQSWSNNYMHYHNQTSSDLDAKNVIYDSHGAQEANPYPNHTYDHHAYNNAWYEQSWQDSSLKSGQRTSDYQTSDHHNHSAYFQAQTSLNSDSSTSAPSAQRSTNTDNISYYPTNDAHTFDTKSYDYHVTPDISSHTIANHYNPTSVVETSQHQPTNYTYHNQHPNCEWSNTHTQYNGQANTVTDEIDYRAYQNNQSYCRNMSSNEQYIANHTINTQESYDIHDKHSTLSSTSNNYQEHHRADNDVTSEHQDYRNGSDHYTFHSHTKSDINHDANMHTDFSVPVENTDIGLDPSAQYSTQQQNAAKSYVPNQVNFMSERARYESPVTPSYTVSRYTVQHYTYHPSYEDNMTHYRISEQYSDTYTYTQ